VFVNKRMLFKVEVTDANLYRNWRGYTVKKVSGEEDIINRFTQLHGINVSYICLLTSHFLFFFMNIKIHRFYLIILFFSLDISFLCGTNCYGLIPA
jgi:hypothetical protein